MKICIIGTGYVGLVAGTCFADTGNTVICVDVDKEKINSLKEGKVPIFEPGLEELIKVNIKENRLIFTTDIDYAVKKSDICFIAVGTPQDKDGSADLQYVFDVAKQIAKSMNAYKIIVNKSTVPVGTAEKITHIISENTKYEFDVVSNPEFLKQGNAVEDFMYSDRVIIGSDSEKVLKIMQEIYSPYLRTNNRIIFMDTKSAEMTKYASNSFLATKISFMNEMANLCEKLGADIEKVRLGMSSDPRIGSKFLFSGIGYGGSCFPKDVNALIRMGENNNIDMKIMNAVSITNSNQRTLFLEKIIENLGSDLSNKRIGIWGLSFKPKTDDMREAPSVTIIEELLKRNASIIAYDPKAENTAKNIFGQKIEYAKSSYEVLVKADALILLTEWNEFRHPDSEKIKLLMKDSLIIDGRNQYDPKLLKEYGIKYICIGRNIS